jgi:hypothetical protein
LTAGGVVCVLGSGACVWALAASAAALDTTAAAPIKRRRVSIVMVDLRLLLLLPGQPATAAKVAPSSPLRDAIGTSGADAAHRGAPSTLCCPVSARASPQSQRGVWLRSPLPGEHEEGGLSIWRRYNFASSMGAPMPLLLRTERRSSAPCARARSSWTLLAGARRALAAASAADTGRARPARASSASLGERLADPAAPAAARRARKSARRMGT